MVSNKLLLASHGDTTPLGRIAGANPRRIMQRRSRQQAHDDEGCQATANRGTPRRKYVNTDVAVAEYVLQRAPGEECRAAADQHQSDRRGQTRISCLLRSERSDSWCFSTISLPSVPS